MTRHTVFALITGLTLGACSPAPASNAPTTGAPGTNPPTSTPATAAPVTFRLTVAPVIKRSCAGCHNPGGSGSSKFICFDAAGEVDHAGIKAGLTESIREVERGRMPRGSNPRLTAQEISALKSWQAAGAPNN